MKADVPKIWRYGFAALGPMGSAGSQFLLSLQLLHVLDQAAFGSFAFLLVGLQLSFGLSSALLCAPYPIFLADLKRSVRDTDRTFLSVNLCFALVGFVVFTGLALALGLEKNAPLLFSAYAAVMLLRWFARAHSYASGTQWRTVTSDLIYGAALSGGIVVMAMTGWTELDLAYGVLLASAVLALIPFGRSYLVEQFLQFSPRALTGYAEVWRRHSMWSLSGVLTTEATGNAHAYIVTLVGGPTSFAPIAASALLIRPISLAMNALTDFERPHMARQMGKGDTDGAVGSMRALRMALIAVWMFCAFIGLALMHYAPLVIFPARYEMGVLVVGVALWFAISGVRSLRTPESVLLQAAGQFRPLAYASFWSCAISVLAVWVLLVTMGPVWSLLGILAGEVVSALIVWRQGKAWREGASVALVLAKTQAGGA